VFQPFNRFAPFKTLQIAAVQRQTKYGARQFQMFQVFQLVHHFARFKR
jgi:hypothetical protein